MFTDRFLSHRRGAKLTADERAVLEASIDQVVTYAPRQIVVKAGELLDRSTLLVEGIMCRYRDDRRGLRQLVAVHVPGDFVDRQFDRHHHRDDAA
jgi:CRP-like cAMP-binding protein